MLQVRITNHAKPIEGEEHPVVIIERALIAADKRYIWIYIDNEAARVDAEELEQAVQACKQPEEV